MCRDKVRPETGGIFGDARPGRTESLMWAAKAEVPVRAERHFMRREAGQGKGRQPTFTYALFFRWQARGGTQFAALTSAFPQSASSSLRDNSRLAGPFRYSGQRMDTPSADLPPSEHA